MKLTDYVADFLAKKEIKYVFGLTGGAVVHLFDSLDKKPGIQPIFTHHEQAAALAAQAYARITNNLGAAVVTTGPGGTNAITGVLAAWMDSIPCIFISGQARMEHTSRGKPIRQLGIQELDIVSVVEPITKYSVMVDDPKKIKYYLEKAISIARSGRPGPVWVDIPLNFQWAQIEPSKLMGFKLPPKKSQAKKEDQLEAQIKKCVNLLCKSKRPIIVAGNGIRLAGAVEKFEKLIKEFGIPFVSSWNSGDLLPNNNSLYLGRIGIAGQRGGNLAVQNCDLLIALGSHLSLNLTGTNSSLFARNAKKIIVDVDPKELAFKKKTIDLPICCDAKPFLSKLKRKLKKNNLNQIKWWRKKCEKYKSYNLPPKSQKKNCLIDPYKFVDLLSDLLGKEDTIVVDGGGTALYMSFQGMKVKKGQRLIVSAGIAAMGTGVPDSIGACFANNKKRTICMIGDGSLQLNIQELQTIIHHNLPIKIFVFNNSGYLAIRHTQETFLKKRFIGSGKRGGISLPDYQKVARAYGVNVVRINNNKELSRKIKQVLKQSGPTLCEIMIPKDQELIPRMGFDMNPDGTGCARPLEDMFPYLDRDEFMENMVVDR